MRIRIQLTKINADPCGSESGFFNFLLVDERIRTLEAKNFGILILTLQLTQLFLDLS
jgi:hypothetical protein